MRVGIVTFHCSYNFGSAIQAYALQTAIGMLGHDASIIDYRSRDFENYRIVNFRHPRNTVKTLMNLRRMLQRRVSFQRFWGEHLKLTPKTYSYRNEEALEELCEGYDCFVCGSDQIWNLDCTKGIINPFFLSFAGSKRRIAYAPSLGHTRFENRYFDRNEVAKLLGRFDRLSVRERDGVDLFQPLVGKPIEVTVDPTLLLGAEAYHPFCASDRDDGYVFVYLLRDCNKLVEYAREIASLGRRVVCVAQRHLGIPNSTQLFGIGPDEFVSLVSHSDFVLSNSFHATVFSILFERPFLSFATDESSSRITDLLDRVGLGDYAVSAGGSAPTSQPNWEVAKKNIETIVEPSWRFLSDSLEDR